jgi:hypothetical protein
MLQNFILIYDDVFSSPDQLLLVFDHQNNMMNELLNVRINFYLEVDSNRFLFYFCTKSQQ